MTMREGSVIYNSENRRREPIGQQRQQQCELQEGKRTLMKWVGHISTVQQSNNFIPIPNTHSPNIKMIGLSMGKITRKKKSEDTDWSTNQIKESQQKEIKKENYEEKSYAKKFAQHIQHSEKKTQRLSVGFAFHPITHLIYSMQESYLFCP